MAGLWEALRLVAHLPLPEALLRPLEALLVPLLVALLHPPSCRPAHRASNP